MATSMPTQPGDFLILRTVKSFRTHALGPVRTHGQQDFNRQRDVRHVADLTEAIAMARLLLASGRQIYLLDIDTRDWSIVSALPKVASKKQRLVPRIKCLIPLNDNSKT